MIINNKPFSQHTVRQNQLSDLLKKKSYLKQIIVTCMWEAKGINGAKMAGLKLMTGNNETKNSYQQVMIGNNNSNYSY